MKNENLYLIRVFNKKETFYKIGLTVHRFCRFYEIMKSGYNIEIVYMIMGINPSEAMILEEKLHINFKNVSYLPLNKFGGYRECFSFIDMYEYKSLTNDIILKSKFLVENILISWH